MVSTSGNSELQSINTRFKNEDERERWRHRLNSEYLKASDKGATTAERTAGAFKSDYKLSERDYLFISVRYDGGVFSGTFPVRGDRRLCPPLQPTHGNSTIPLVDSTQIRYPRPMMDASQRKLQRPGRSYVCYL